MSKLKHQATNMYLFAAILFSCLFWTHTSSAQWIIYNFSPQAAYQASYGLTNNTNSSSTSILTNGWPTNWSNSTTNNRGILAVQFSTNTNTPNVMTCLQPLIYTYSTNTNTLTNANYTNVPQIALTNTNSTGVGSLSNACYILRANFTNSVYMAGQYSLVVTNAGTNVGTNSVGTFNSICVGYTTTNIGTNGVPTGTNYYPAILQLKISSLSGTNVTNVLNQQLVLPLSINTALTKIVNTNTNFGSNALIFTSNVMYSNLVKCIRSNSTYTNF
ncbi:MAG: hypothetical protein EBT07_05555 [Actinobacteria bacterium]|nr:hypothetical protein [Actinomycetota bacterium]